MPVSKVDLAYTAGVIDSDGCIAINRTRGGYRYFTPRIEIGQIDTKALRYIGKLFNFTRYNANHCTKNNKAFHQLIITGETCALLLNKILPYLRIKNNQAKIVLKLCKRLKDSAKWYGATSKLSENEVKIRYNLYKQIRKLNGR